MALDSLRVSVVVPARDNHDLTRACLDSVRRASEERSVEVLVVDDGSIVPLRDALDGATTGCTVLRHEHPVGFTGAANLGSRAASGHLVLLLNNDTELEPDALGKLCEAFESEPRLGVAGAQLFYPDGAPQWSGGRRPGLLWLLGQASGLPRVFGSIPGYRRVRPLHRRREVDWVPAAALAFRREAWTDIGPFDESLGAYAQDLDLCLRAKARGWTVRSIEAVRVRHHHGATMTRLDCGSADSLLPEQLWTSLLVCSHKHDGSAFAKRARLAIRLGASLRLAGRALSRPLVSRNRRAIHDQETIAYRSALDAVIRFSPSPTSSFEGAETAFAAVRSRRGASEAGSSEIARRREIGIARGIR